MPEKPRVLAIVGPTASGKTALGAECAKRFGGEVISADSMQIYEGLDIATAKPTQEEMQGIPHHLIGIVPRTQRFSVADYVKLAAEKITEITGRGRLPVIVGGTGLYVDSLLSGMQFSPEEGDPGIREALAQRYRQEGGEALWKELDARDPEAAARIHPNNSVRLIRALEVMAVTGGTFTAYKQQNAGHPAPYDALMIGLDWERSELYARIDRRVDLMVEQGLLEEVAAARDPAMQTSAAAIGYKELLPYLDGQMPLADCIALVKQETRRYAKRQLTWFRRNDQIRWLKVGYSNKVDKLSEKIEIMMEKNPGICYNEA